MQRHDSILILLPQESDPQQLTYYNNKNNVTCTLQFLTTSCSILPAERHTFQGWVACTADPSGADQQQEQLPYSQRLCYIAVSRMTVCRRCTMQHPMLAQFSTTYHSKETRPTQSILCLHILQSLQASPAPTQYQDLHTNRSVCRT